MAAFAASGSASLSSDGLTLTLEDLSNYISNDSSYTTGNFTREFILTDADSNAVATVPITGSALTVPWTIPNDMWLNIELALTGISPAPNYSFSFALACDRQTKNLYRTILQQGCCPNQLIDRRLAFGEEYLYGAAIEQLAGNGDGFNTDIQAAASYLNASKF